MRGRTPDLNPQITTRCCIESIGMRDSSADRLMDDLGWSQGFNVVVFSAEGRRCNAQRNSDCQDTRSPNERHHRHADHRSHESERLRGKAMNHSPTARFLHHSVLNSRQHRNLLLGEWFPACGNINELMNSQPRRWWDSGALPVCSAQCSG